MWAWLFIGIVFIGCAHSAVEELDSFLDEVVLTKVKQLLQSSDESGGAICEDKETVCDGWKKAGACEAYRENMRIHCAKTCDLCRAPSPPLPEIPACSKTKYGCCWDNKTIAQAPVSNLALSACSPCLDSQSQKFCNYWFKDCKSDVKGQGDFMRERCPTTCGVPCNANMNVNDCRDHESKELCFAWAEDGKCTNKPKDMKALCPATCKFCVPGSL